MVRLCVCPEGEQSLLPYGLHRVRPRETPLPFGEQVKFRGPGPPTPEWTEAFLVMKVYDIIKASQKFDRVCFGGFEGRGNWGDLVLSFW